MLAELLAPRSHSIVCIDASERVVAAARRERLKGFGNVEVRTGMHALDFPAKRFDLVLLLHALTYSEKPATAIAEAARVLRKGGRLLAMTLGRHAHRTTVEPFDHRNLGFKPEDLREYARASEARHHRLRAADARAASAAFRSPESSGEKTMSLHLPWLHPARAEALREALARRILVIDGAMGTMVQSYRLDERDYRGERFADGFDRRHEPDRDAASQPGIDLKGNNDLLTLTRPDVIGAIHAAYLDAGADLVETGYEFNATARRSQADYRLEHIVHELNREGARLARAACDAAEAKTPGRPRFVIGVLGPTSRTASISPDVNDPGFRNTSFDALRDTYREAAEGLVDGGADTIMVETIFDTLNAKAALYAVDELFEARGARLPVMISGTITDRSGRTLSGQTAEAFYASMHHARPLSIGLNCALGAARATPVCRCARRCRRLLHQHASERRPAERVRRIRRIARAHGRDRRRICARWAREPGRRLLRHDAGAHRGDRRSGARCRATCVAFRIGARSRMSIGTRLGPRTPAPCPFAPCGEGWRWGGG